MMKEKLNAKISLPASGLLLEVKDLPVTSYETGRYASMNAVSKVARAALKAAGVRPANYRFKSDSYSMGSSLRLRETENAKESDRNTVLSILNELRDGWFDGMTDSYNYTGALTAELEDGTTVSVGTKYTFLESVEGYMV